MYHTGASVDPLWSIIVTDAGLTVSQFPFQAFGLGALFILFLMAATSHDFWLANLTAPVWKSLHMAVYPAYLFLIIHVVFGILQSETSPFLAVSAGVGFIVVVGSHLYAGYRQAGMDRESSSASSLDGMVEACRVDEIPEDGAKGVIIAGERVAIVKYEGKISALSGVCQHQNGPLAEGKFVHGCLTCPWHGYQYKCEDGTSPEPFKEKIPTFSVKVSDGVVYVDPNPHPAGTAVEPALIT